MVSHIGQVDKLGCFVFADGDRYDGHFRRGAMHGYGVYYWANDRATYFGKWDDNAQSGCGVKFYGNGGVEFGEWKDDQYLGQYTGVCGQQESYAAMNNAVDVAQRARMFKYKPDSEVTLQRRPFTMHQDPVVYQSGTEWTMPGWRGEQYPAPSAEELEREHPRLYAQMQRHNEIWERAWRYYNLDLKDAQAFGVEKKARASASASSRARGVHGPRGGGRLRRVRRRLRRRDAQEEQEGQEGWQEGWQKKRRQRRVAHALPSLGGGVRRGRLRARAESRRAEADDGGVRGAEGARARGKGEGH